MFGFKTLLNISGHLTEREKADKFCSEALISALGSFMCRKSTTRDPQLLPFQRKSYSGFLGYEKIHRPQLGSNPRTSDPEASVITTGSLGSTLREEVSFQRLNIFTATALGRGRVASPTLSLLYSEKSPRYSFYRRLSGPQDQSGHEEKYLPLRHPGSNPGRPARSPAPCSLSYLALTCSGASVFSTIGCQSVVCGNDYCQNFFSLKHCEYMK